MATIIGDGITFDDVLLVPSYSEVIPNQVEIGTELTHAIKLNIPFAFRAYAVYDVYERLRDIQLHDMK